MTADASCRDIWRTVGDRDAPELVSGRLSCAGRLFEIAVAILEPTLDVLAAP